MTISSATVWYYNTQNKWYLCLVLKVTATAACSPLLKFREFICRKPQIQPPSLNLQMPLENICEAWNTASSQESLRLTQMTVWSDTYIHAQESIYIFLFTNSGVWQLVCIYNSSMYFSSSNLPPSQSFWPPFTLPLIYASPPLNNPLQIFLLLLISQARNLPGNRDPKDTELLWFLQGRHPNHFNHQMRLDHIFPSSKWKVAILLPPVRICCR